MYVEVATCFLMFAETGMVGCASATGMGILETCVAIWPGVAREAVGVGDGEGDGEGCGVDCCEDEDGDV